MPTRLIKRFAALAVLAVLCAGLRPTDDLDAFIETQMARRQIVGLSLAIIDDGRIVETRTYGTTTRGGSVRVTPATLFQAGSISKPVAALGALRLVQSGKLSLDADVNDKLKSWKVPDSEFTTTERVTLRRLLSHTAGLTVHGFPGYDVTERMPSVPEVLDGKGNTAPVRVNVVPGSIWRYSGGGYTVMQQLVADVTGQPFETYMRDNVLKPLGMDESTYEQPLPAALASKTATGYRGNRSAVPGKWHVYPEKAAAGLWTTPSDLARYAIGVQQALAGKSKVLSADMTRRMLTVEKGGYGLGPGVADSGQTLRFSHGGRDDGFDAQLIAYARTGDGVAIMINANDNSRAVSRIINFIAKKYDWPNYPVPAPEVVQPAQISAAALAAVTGRYEFTNNNMLTLAAENGRIYTDVTGLLDEEFVPAGADRFVSAERAVSFKVVQTPLGAVEALDWTQNNTTRRIARIGPLFTTSSASDPDAEFTRNAELALRQLAEGGAAVTASELLTAGARGAFTGANPEFKGVRSLAFVHAHYISSGNVQRHGHEVVGVIHYRVQTDAGEKLVLVHLDENGLIADYDIVSR